MTQHRQLACADQLECCDTGEPPVLRKSGLAFRSRDVVKEDNFCFACGTRVPMVQDRQETHMGSHLACPVRE